MPAVPVIIVCGLLLAVLLGGLFLLLIAPHIPKKRKKKPVYQTEQQHRLEVEAMAKKRQIKVNTDDDEQKLQEIRGKALIVNAVNDKFGGPFKRGRN